MKIYTLFKGREVELENKIKQKNSMSKTMQILFGVVAFLVVIFVLIPMLPNTFYIHTIVLIGTIIAAILWVLSLGGISLP